MRVFGFHFNHDTVRITYYSYYYIIKKISVGKSGKFMNL